MTKDQAEQLLPDLVEALRILVGPKEYGPHETAIGSDTPVIIRCQLGDLRRAWSVLARAGE